MTQASIDRALQPTQSVAIAVSGVSKTFRLPHETRTTLRAHLMHPLRRTTYEVQRALDGVTFTVAEGEFFGVIGRNGSGKSTLLKLLAGIYPPDVGRLDIRGRLSPFIELGVGFNPDLTARDNVRINGTLMGLGPDALEERFDEILAFAELERFVDQKLKNYSSGMQLRLAYAIAIQVPFDVLLLDEVLAVGDQNFQEKCFETFETMRRQGKTVVLVTHDLGSVRRFCDRALLLREGRQEALGPSHEVVDAYLTQEQDVSGFHSVGALTAAPRAEVDHSLAHEPASSEARPASGRHDAANAFGETEGASRDPVESDPEPTRRDLERTILEQQLRLESRAARIRDLHEYEADVEDLRRAIAILECRYYGGKLALPPRSLIRGSRRTEANFLFRGLRWSEMALSVFGTEPEAPVLEWECGPGGTFRWLRKYPRWVVQYRGCDADEAIITWLRENTDAAVVRSGVEPPLPYDDASLGGVFTSLTRHAPASYRRWIAEFSRIVKPGGLIYLVVHGPPESTARPLRRDLERRGWALIVGPGGTATSYVTRPFMEAAMGKALELLEYRPQGYNVLDTYTFRRSS